MSKRWSALYATAAVWLTPALAWASDESGTRAVINQGVSGIWVLANVSYAGMRAQNNPDEGWRFAAFFFGFPGTLVSYFAVKEGKCEAYGIRLPRG